MIRLLDLLRKFTGINTASASSKKVDEAIERVVDGIDVKLRLVPSYQKKLREAVSTAMQHIDRLVEQVPGPYNFSRMTYTSDPDVRAYFASPDIMQVTFSTSPELQSFFSDINNCEIDSCYALLCSNKQEKTILGSGLVGDVVRHDVMQTAINFFDYKVLSPAASDCDVRTGIKQCIFDGLVTHALQHIAGIKMERRDLQDQQRILHAQLRARQSQGNGLSTMMAEGHANKHQSEGLETQCREAGNKLEKMLGRLDVLSFYLDEVRRILSKPENFIQLNVACFRLSDMRIKVDDNAPEIANTVCFSELEIANVLKRVVAVASYSRDEMQYNH
jgi:hypothetical protein